MTEEINGVVYLHTKQEIIGYTSKIPEHVEILSGYSIKEGAFENCEKIKTISMIDNNLKNDTNTIGMNAFKGCVNLQQADISFFETVEKYAFSGCVNLQKVNIGKETLFFDSYAFEECYNLEDVNFDINPNAFLDKYTIQDTKYYKNHTNENNLVIVNNTLLDAQKATGIVVVPNHITEIGVSAFEDGNPTKIILSPNTTSILHNAFNGCMAEIITIPEGVKNIANGAFKCPKLKEMTLPSSAKIKDFYNTIFCPNVKTLHWNYSEKPTKKIFDAFPRLETLTYNGQLLYKEGVCDLLKLRVMNNDINNFYKSLNNR